MKRRVFINYLATATNFSLFTSVIFYQRVADLNRTTNGAVRVCM